MISRGYKTVLTICSDLPRWVLVLTLLAACAQRGHLSYAPASATSGPVETVFVGSTRKVDPETGTFGKGRSEATAYARFEIAIPPDRALGDITYAPRHGPPDPARDFVTTAQVMFPDAAAFRASLHAQLARQPKGKREVMIFVHGYNSNFSEGLYRIAQLKHDLDPPGIALHYAWPSAATPFGYVYDRDSALFARAGLVDLIHQAQAAGAVRITLVAHSMGCGLTMEALRTLAEERDGRAMQAIGGVILISPDIDVDVFRAQAHDVGVLPQPFVIFASAEDKILKLSARLTGQTERLGSMDTLSRVADLKVTVLDDAAFNQGSGHFNLADSPAMISLLGRLGDISADFNADKARRVGLLSGVVLTLQNATMVVMSPVVNLAGGRN